MDFTREPVIETIITPKEGHKLVVRSSKGFSQEEHFVDAIEVISFGNSFFFRSRERPKSFMVPVSDYELIEVRETRMVLKTVSSEKTIKIGGGKDQPARQQKAAKKPSQPLEEEKTPRLDKKRERRRHSRRRKTHEEGADEDQDLDSVAGERVELPLPSTEAIVPPNFSSFLKPPPKLIAETIHEYKTKDQFRDIFVEDTPSSEPHLEPPHLEDQRKTLVEPDDVEKRFFQEGIEDSWTPPFEETEAKVASENDADKA